MSIRQSPFEGVNGAALVVSSGGDTLSNVSGSATYTTSQFAHGASSLVASASSAAWYTIDTTTDRALIRGYGRISTAISSDTTLGIIYAGSNLKAAQLIINAASRIRLQTFGGTTSTSVNVATATDALPVNTWFRWEMWVSAGTSETNGQVRAAYYIGDSTTPVWDSGLITGNTAGTLGVITQGRIALATNLGIDDFGLKDGNDAVWGAWPASQGITANATTTSNLVMIDARTSTGGSGVLTYSISPSSGVTEPTEGVFLVPQTGSTQNFTVTATDGILTDTTTVTVTPASAPTQASMRHRTWTGSTWA